MWQFLQQILDSQRGHPLNRLVQMNGHAVVSAVLNNQEFVDLVDESGVSRRASIVQMEMVPRKPTWLNPSEYELAERSK